MIKLKKGVNTEGLKQPMLRPINTAHFLMQMTGNDLVITDAIRPPSPNSLHPDGYAVDIRTRDLTKNQKNNMVLALNYLLGKDYDVVQYDTHIHIEYQRYLDDSLPLKLDHLEVVE